MKRLLGALVLVPILFLWSGLQSVEAQTTAASVRLRYGFSKGQKRTYTIKERTTDRTEGAGAAASEDGEETHWNGVVLEILDVAPDGSADFRFSFDYLRMSKSIGPGTLAIDTRRPVRATNPFLAEIGPEGESALKTLETTHQIINKVFINAPLRFTVTNRGRVSRVSGMDELWDRYRVEAGKVLTDPAKRAEMDIMIEGFFGEKAVKKTIGDNFFILLPEEPVAEGQEWTDRFTYELGAIQLPMNKTYKLEGDPAATPLRVAVSIEFGTPPPTEEVRFKMIRNRVDGTMTVDLQSGFIPDCRYGGPLEFAVYSPDAPSQRLARAVITIDGVIASRVWKDGRPPEGEEVTFFKEGVEHFQGRRFTQAIESFRRAIEAKPDWAEPYERIGMALMLLDREDEAIEAFLDAIRIEPHAETYQNLGIAYNQAGRFRDAAEVLKKAIALEPQPVRTYIELGKAYRESYQCEEAVESYKEVVRLNPKDGSTHSLLGSCYRDLGKVDDAIREFREVTRLEPNNADGHFVLANTYAGAKRTDEAIASFKKAVELDLKSARYRTELARFYFANERYADAVEMLKESIALDPKSIDARRGLAFSYFKLGKKDLALEQAREIETLDPESAEAVRKAIAQ